MRDFLVQIREFTGEDDTDLYLEEREVGFSFCQLKDIHIFISDCSESCPRREEESADVSTWNPQPPRGCGGDAGLAHPHRLLLFKQSSPSLVVIFIQTVVASCELFECPMTNSDFKGPEKCRLKEIIWRALVGFLSLTFLSVAFEVKAQRRKEPKN